MDIPFTKMTGIGNDYIYFDCISHDIPIDEIIAIIPKISKRRFGIGSDGVIFILPSEKADAKMQMHNADGSKSEMCGNGLRCVVAYTLYKLTDKDTVTIETDAGLAKGTLTQDGQVRVEMFGEPVIENEGETVHADDQTFTFSRVNVGNPHAVIAYDGIDSIPLDIWGPAIENNLELFPERVNTEFYQEVSPGHVKMRVWERGSGETYACGTGAAAVAAAYRKICQKDEIKVSLLGGDLTFTYENNKFYMTGPATYVATGTLDLQGWK